MHASEREVADNLALLTDLYQLTMGAAYFAEGMTAPATFSFFVRAYPAHRAYFVATGLEDVLRYLESFHFSADSLRYLRRTGLYRDDFLDYLAQLRFTGDVWALSEGSICFVPEPLIEVTAPIIEAQLVETYVINQLHLQTVIATKAARCYHAAQGRDLVDFSLRRTHGSDAGMKVARASYIAGFTGSSNVLAEKRYGIPAFGTMAHSYVESFDDEIDAFRAFARLFPANSTLLVDTYDTLSGVRKAAIVGKEMAARGAPLSAVRLDSGDLFELSHGARRILDGAGLHGVKIFASGGLNEYKVADLLGRGAPIDAFGVGTDMGVSGDAPWLDCAYKLVEYAGQPRLKLSSHKETWVGRKQVWRACDDTGGWHADMIGLRSERAAAIASQLDVVPARVEPRLVQVMCGGRISESPPALGAIRERFLSEFGMLPEGYKALAEPAQYPVQISAELRRVQAAAAAAVRARMLDAR
ncbi:MAG TPA: nicotinate phosphoribosyltransferase [Candidatus Acidoferrales bacterium]|nr:nicotinate phosphoribosyltransferase [Candidatus Acidoferrales bacterium]